MLNADISVTGDRHDAPLKMGGQRYDTVKRTIDFTIAIIAIIVLLPLLAMVATAILGCSGRPIIFKHRRIGAGGQTFSCLKFRTMHKNGDDILYMHLADNQVAQEEWLATRKLKVDPRITTVGRFLRKSSIDEIPQLLNVVAGHMSLVGPRPIVKEEALFYGEKIDVYCSTRPGITGPWQIGGRSDTSYASRVRMDCEYVKNRSNFSDLLILAKTVPVILSTRGSY